MTKTELISAMAAECGLSKTDAGKALDAFMHQATVALASGEKVMLTGFGVFDPMVQSWLGSMCVSPGMGSSIRFAGPEPRATAPGAGR